MSDLNGVPEREADTEPTVRTDGASVRAKLTVLRGKLVEAQSAVREKCQAAYETTDDFAHAKPWQTIAAAMIGGLVVGMLAAR